MPAFDDSKTQDDLDALRAREEEELSQVLSEKYGVGYIDLTRQSINVEALRLIGEEEAKAAQVAAFEKLDRKVSLAAKSPISDDTKKIIEKLKEAGYEVELFMVSTASLERAWSRYEELSGATASRGGLLEIATESVQKTLESISDLRGARSAINETLTSQKAYRISHILETVLGAALALNASDVHIEPEETHIRLRFRLDGVLIDTLTFDKETYNLLLSRIKLISGLKLNLKDRAQDGRFSIRVHGSEVEVRTSILPESNGETAVMRLLDPKTTELPMEALGINEKLFRLLDVEIRRPNGMLLNTGPTGSGKTTSLYSFLRKIHTPEIKIITIEDPIEYHLEGIVQTQVDHKNYTFAGGLRSALRQDPDVIMVGEIRDKEVAETAINAALTGHFVFSTLHTNNAAGAFPRLIDLGVNPKVISSAVRVVMAQRLVRKLKEDNKKEIKLTGARKDAIDKILESVVDTSLIPKNTSVVWEPEKSDEETPGYAGRMGVFEAIVMDHDLEKMVEASSSEREIEEVAVRQGHLTLTQDGIIKALNGLTSLSELERVLDIPEFAKLKSQGEHL